MREGGNLLPKSDNSTFDPETTAAMAMALDQVCDALKIDADKSAREVIATRIVELARRGERDPMKLRDRLLREAHGAREF
jgi:hypothetical protein